MWKGSKYLCKRGEIFCGERTLARETDIHRSKVHRLIKMFKSEQLIETRDMNISSLITITNYDKYHASEPPNEPRVNHERTTSEPRVNQSKEYIKNVKNEKNKALSCKHDLDAPILYLNQKASTKFNPKANSSRNLVKARYNEGRTLDDFKLVIDKKCAKWLTNENMVDYLRPSTLFNRTNFENYMNEKKGKYDGLPEHLRPQEATRNYR